MPDNLIDQAIARFVFTNRDVKSDGTLRRNALQPKSGDALSVYETKDLAHPEVCDHGREYVDAPDNSRVHIGYGKIAIKDILQEGLTACFDNDPPRHVSMHYPEGIDPEKIKAIATAIGTAAQFKECNPLT